MKPSTILHFYLQIWDVEFVIHRQVILFTGNVVQYFPCLLACFFSWRTDEPELVC